MQKSLLVTISEDPRSLNSIRCIAQLFPQKKDVKLTLFYVTPKPPSVLQGEGVRGSLRAAKVQERQWSETGKGALEAAREEALALGFTEEGLEMKLKKGMVSKVTDIVHEGERGQYDAVALGPRGLSWFEGVFGQSVSRDLLQKKMSFPLWICRGGGKGRKNILLCLDGSELAYRAADHVGFILADQLHHRVTLLQVEKTRKAQKEEESIFQRAEELLKENGFPPDQTDRKVLEETNIAKAIMKESEEGKYAAVAVGRAGLGRGMMDMLFYGSVCDRLFNELKEPALWISH
ncbi:MAG: universal stress protein [Deltaproteobacteria bacterium]|nr:universal stress protein [Deltaproteobacteria bacterium]